MKKINALLAFSALMASSLSAFAAPTPIASGALVPALDCPLLAEDVRIPLSTGVIASYNCEGAGLAIRVAACHSNGRVGERTVEVPCRATGDTSQENAALPVCAAPNTTVNRVTNSGAAIMLGRTTGGQVGPTPIDGTTCTATGVASRIQ